MIGDKKKCTDNVDRTAKRRKVQDSDKVPTVVPTVASYVTLKCQKYKQWIPQIGQVVALDDTTITVDWLDGTYSGTWCFWKHRGKPVHEIFP